MMRIILVLGIGFGTVLAEARDWGFSKDTVNAFNGLYTSYEMRDGVRWPKFDSVYLENHGTTALKFDTATLEMIRPKINPDSGWCTALVTMDLNLRSGLNGPEGEYTFLIPAVKYLPTGFETFSLQPGEKIIVGPTYLGDGRCSPYRYMDDSISVRLVFTSGKVNDTLYVNAGAAWTHLVSNRNSEKQVHKNKINRVGEWVKSFFNRDLKGRNTGP